MEQTQLLPQGVWTLEEVKEHSREKGICPYFAIRRMVRFSKKDLSINLDTRFDRHTFILSHRSSLFSLATVRRHHHLLFPLSARSKGCRASLEADEQRSHRSL